VLSNTLTETLCNSWAEGISNTLPFITLDHSSLSNAISFIITTVLVTFAVVLFGEVAPKVYAKINNA